MISRGLLNWIYSYAHSRGLSPEETEELVSGVCVRDAVATNPLGMMPRAVAEDYWIYYNKWIFN